MLQLQILLPPQSLHLFRLPWCSHRVQAVWCFLATAGVRSGAAAVPASWMCSLPFFRRLFLQCLTPTFCAHQALSSCSRPAPPCYRCGCSESLECAAPEGVVFHGTRRRVAPYICFMHIYIDTYTYTYLCIYICIYVYIYVYVYLYLFASIYMHLSLSLSLSLVHNLPHRRAEPVSHVRNLTDKGQNLPNTCMIYFRKG